MVAKVYDAKFEVGKFVGKNNFRSIGVLEYLNAFNEILCKLINIDVKLEDKNKALLLLTSLLSLFEKCPIELEDVTTSFLSKEIRKNPINELSKSKNRYKFISKSRSNFEKFKVRNFECRKLKYYKRENKN
uniref:Uncharacterized protein n=1 Tax=Physcomitrium patens TaxID=3218 RepID=A0A2K1KNB5_PHYPA|nr:hypothetical protein PHYPA_006170 [Physcomitrium patens]